MTAPKDIKGLVERFQENRDVYCSSEYNEAQARIEFIDPLFKALGWTCAQRWEVNCSCRKMNNRSSVARTMGLR